MVKADAHSENAQRLQAAGHKVKKAADTLVKAAQSAAVFEEQEVCRYIVQYSYSGDADRTYRLFSIFMLS